MQEFAKQEAALKKKVAPPTSSMMCDVELLVKKCAAQGVGTGKILNDNLRALLNLAGVSTNGPKPELVYRIFESQARMATLCGFDVEDVRPTHKVGPNVDIDDEFWEEKESDEEDEHVCSKCRESVVTDSNGMLVCKTCGLCMHEECVGGTWQSGEIWKCRACTLQDGSSGAEFVPEERVGRIRKRPRGLKRRHRRRTEGLPGAKRPRRKSK